MADNIRHTLTKESRLIYSSITQKSAPRNVAGAEPKFSATFGLCKEDFDLIIPLMVQAIQSETGSFSGNPNDYFLACMSGQMAAQRVRQSAELNAQALAHRGDNDGAFKLREKAEKRAGLYEGYAGILQASSKFDVELARLDAGKIVDIKEPHAIAAAGKDLFYPGAWVVPAVSFKGFRRKKLDDKDGVTAYLQNVLFIRKGEKIDTGGGASNQEVFGGFSGYTSYDPTAMAPGGGSGWDGAQQQGQAQGFGGMGNGQQPGNPMTQNSTTGFPSDPNNAAQNNAAQNNGQGGFSGAAQQESAPAW